MTMLSTAVPTADPDSSPLARARKVRRGDRELRQVLEALAHEVQLLQADEDGAPLCLLPREQGREPDVDQAREEHHNEEEELLRRVLLDIEERAREIRAAAKVHPHDCAEVVEDGERDAGRRRVEERRDTSSVHAAAERGLVEESERQKRTSVSRSSIPPIDERQKLRTGCVACAFACFNLSFALSLEELARALSSDRRRSRSLLARAERIGHRLAIGIIVPELPQQNEEDEDARAADEDDGDARPQRPERVARRADARAVEKGGGVRRGTRVGRQERRRRRRWRRLGEADRGDGVRADHELSTAA